MADRPLLLVSDEDRAVADQLHERGFHSIFDIARLPASVFAEQWRDAPGDSQQIHERARYYVTLVTQHYQRLTQRHEPSLTHARKTDVDKIPDIIEQSLGPELGFEDLFGEAQEFARPDSVESLFSPAAYLAELYAVATKLHPVGHSLNLRQRRPDLENLILSEHTLNGEVTALQLVLQVLEEGFGDEKANEHLAAARYPMTLPYHQALTTIRAALDVRKHSLSEIWSRLSDREAHILNREFTQSIWLFSQIEDMQLAHRAGQAIGMEAVPSSRFRLMTERKYFCEIHLAWLVGSPFFNLLGRWVLTGGINYGYLEDTGNFERTAFSTPAPPNFPYRLLLASDNSFHIVKDNTSLTQQDMYFYFRDSGNPHTFSFIRDGDEVSLSTLFGMEELPYRATPTLREANVLSPGLMAFLTLPFDEDQLPAYYGLTSPDYSSFKRARDFCQITNLNLDELVLLTAENRFFGSVTLGADPYEAVSPTTYGAVYVNNASAHPNDPPLSITGEPTDEEFNNYTPQRLHRVNQWIRLIRVTGLDFTQLDWAYQLTDAQFRHTGPGEFWRPRSAASLGPLLELLGQYRHMKDRSSIPFDEFCAYFGDLNGYAEKGRTSFYDQAFNPQGAYREPLILPVQSAVIFDPSDDTSRPVRVKLCRGLQLSDAALCVLARYVPGVDEAGITPSLTLSQVSSLYRLAAVPRRFGLTIFDALALWHLLDPSGTSPYALADARSLTLTLDLLRRTERIADWMKQNELHVVDLHALVAREYPTVATPELYNWLINLVTSVQAEEEAVPGFLTDDDRRLRLASHLATPMAVKPLVAVQLSHWADHVCTAVEGLEDYHLEKFWEDAVAWYDIQKIESASAPNRDWVLRLSQEYPHLIQYTFMLGQLARWQHWANLSEQDLGFIVDTPAQLIADPPEGPEVPLLPSLTLLLWIARFKAWQQQIHVPVEEALQYFATVGEMRLADEASVSWAREELARIHDWREDQVAYVMTWLFGENGLPTSFDTLYRVAVRMTMGMELNVSVQEVERLERLAEEDDEAIFERVATALEAGLPW